MIQGWDSDEAEGIFKGKVPRGVHQDIAKAARRRLQQLDAATSVEDMAVPPGNRLHKVGKVWAIRVNDQYRITFIWGAQGPVNVWFGDYH